MAYEFLMMGMNNRRVDSRPHLVLSQSDVYYKASFYCELVIGLDMQEFGECGGKSGNSPSVTGSLMG